MASKTLCSVGRSAAATRVIAKADQAPGTHQAWRYQSGGRVVVMGTNCESSGPEPAAQFRTLNVKTLICRTRPTKACNVLSARVIRK